MKSSPGHTNRAQIERAICRIGSQRAHCRPPRGTIQVTRRRTVAQVEFLRPQAPHQFDTGANIVSTKFQSSHVLSARVTEGSLTLGLSRFNPYVANGARQLKGEQFSVPDPIRVDVRIIGATSRNLATMVKEGKFREDLIYADCPLAQLQPSCSSAGGPYIIANYETPRNQPLPQLTAA